ncbi:Atlastin-2 [Halotydeus destructor]|nr:Atlastin-2 [Halotydeus destructor]
MPGGRPSRRRGGPGRGCLIRSRPGLPADQQDETSGNRSVPSVVDQVTFCQPTDRVLRSHQPRVRARTTPQISQRQVLLASTRNRRLARYRSEHDIVQVQLGLQNQVIDCHYAGTMTAICQYCQAFHFAAERTGDHFTACCHNGKVALDAIQQHPFIDLHLKSPGLRQPFLDSIREYNSALAFGSLTTSGIMQNHPGRGPFSLKVHGGAYRLIGSLNARSDQKPAYAQLFYIDNAQAQRERMMRPENKASDPSVMAQLNDILTQVNPYVQSIKLMREVEAQECNTVDPFPEMSLYFLTDKTHDQRRYNLPTMLQDVGAVFVSSDGAPPSTDARDWKLYFPIVSPTMAMDHSGRAVRIIHINDRTKDFELDTEAMEEILTGPECRDRLVSVVSIAGATRKGKSFMLNLLLKYLQTGESGDWLGLPDSPLKGFSWRGGAQRDTTGILLWSRPAVIKIPDGREVAVLLMDTQGAFDGLHTVADTAAIFAISTLTSSVQIYNLFTNIQEDDRQNLEMFSEYGQLALKESTAKSFQKLLFLVRDWQYPQEYDYGLKGGKQFLDSKLEVSVGRTGELARVKNY